MKKSLAGLMLCLSISAQAAPWWTPSPLGVALTMGRWISIDREETFEIRVQAQAPTETQARDEALRIAVDRAVGSLMIVNTESQQGDIKRHEVINYAAGYVHDFTVVSRKNINQETQLVLDVRVKRSTIADRLLADSKDSAAIFPGNVGIRHATQSLELRRGDQALESILKDYPRRAYSVQITAHRVRLTSERTVEIEVDARITLDHRYLRALQELLEQMGGSRPHAHQHQVSLDYVEPGSFFRSTSTVGFDDVRRIGMLRDYLIGSNPQIRARVQGHSGTILTQCFSHNELSQTGYQPARRFVHWGETRTIINGLLVTQPTIKIVLPSGAVEQLKHLDLEVVSSIQCKSSQRNHIYTTRHGHS